MRIKIFFVITIFLCSLLMALPLFADRGHVILEGENLTPNMSVYESAQNAVVAWNGREEILILSTDLKTEKKAKVLEFIPLPSKPSEIKELKENLFAFVDKIIQNHAPVSEDFLRGKNGNSPETTGTSQVQIVMHEKVGPHDITVAYTKNSTEFIKWVKDFLKGQGIEYKTYFDEKFKPVVKNYMGQGIYYFVFDIVELDNTIKSTKPLMYKFPSGYLYYPLFVSTMGEGETNVNLFLLTYKKPDIWGTGTGFKCGFYTMDGIVSYNDPIKFKVTSGELQIIDERLKSHFNSSSRDVWFTASHYKGSVKLLTKDFILY